MHRSEVNRKLETVVESRENCPVTRHDDTGEAWHTSGTQ
jgi:hypothetical protein